MFKIINGKKTLKKSKFNYTFIFLAANENWKSIRLAWLTCSLWWQIKWFNLKERNLLDYLSFAEKYFFNFIHRLQITLSNPFASSSTWRLITSVHLELNATAMRQIVSLLNANGSEELLNRLRKVHDSFVCGFEIRSVLGWNVEEAVAMLKGKQMKCFVTFSMNVPS
jgi:hypothetical protein